MIKFFDGKYFWILTMLIFVYSCKEKNKHVSDFLRAEAEKKDIDYDELLKRSFEGDSLSIITISTLKFTNSANSENGSHLLDVFDSLGEKKITNILRSCSAKQKNIVYYNLIGGTDFTSNEKFIFKDVDSIFPILSKELTGRK